MPLFSPRPLITFALISYKEEKFIEEAVKAALAQTYRPLEIILSNDCSPDRTFEKMREIADRYRGEHEIILNRNEKNLGTGEHINRIMELSSGSIVVIAAADDISLPDRTHKLYEIFRKGKGQIKSVFSNACLIDEAGNDLGLHYDDPVRTERLIPEKIVRGYEFGLVAGSSHAWTRDLFDRFGPLRTPLSVEDSAIAFRAALLGRIAYTHEPLIKQRRHANNTWQYTVTDPLKDIRYQTFEKEAVLRNWEADLRTFEETVPGKKEQFAESYMIIARKMAEVREDIELFRSTWLKRAFLLSAKIIKGMPLRIARQKIGAFLMAPVYRRYALLRKKAESRRVRGKNYKTRGNIQFIDPKKTSACEPPVRSWDQEVSEAIPDR